MLRIVFSALLALALTACGDSSPGPLAGTWQSGGFLPMKTTFRTGETETMGVIEKVGYTVNGQSVIVTYKDGMMKGTAMRFVLVNPTTARGLDTTYRKVGN
jgi:hypothetical protein